MSDSLLITQSQGDCPQLQKRAIKMRLLWIGIGILILFLTIIFLFTQILTRQEQESKIQNVRNNGAHLVSLISLYPMKDFETDKRDFFLRTLIQYTSNEGILYLFIHDHSGNPIVSSAPVNISSIIPDDIKMRSLYTMGLSEQNFKYGDSGDIIYEFAKPIFEKGEKTGTVRLGIRLNHVSILSLQRISLLSMIPFFLFAALLLGYYGINTAFKPLKNFHENFKSSDIDLLPNVNINIKNGRIMPLIDALEQSLNQIKDKLDQIKTVNNELTSKLGVTTFEKNQIMKILDTINFGIIITDMQNNVNYTNEYMFKLLNKTREEVIRRPLEEILNHEEIISFISRTDILEQNRTSNFKEIILPDLEPGETYQITSAYTVDSNMTPIGRVMFIKNITSEKISEEAKHTFIAHTAHELLTPLTNIKSYSEMLMEGEIQDSEVQREFYNTINEETNRLSLLVQNLLSISKIEMGRLTINKGLVRTDWFVNGCLTPIEASAKNKNIIIEKILPEIFPTLIADKELLKGAIINLLGNALKYTPESGKVTFSITEQDNNVVFEVMDTGYGIAREDIPRIFDKFYRSSNPYITRQTGSGLGLAITSDIVHLHNGTIEVESQLGEGSHFTIRIPKEEYQIGKG